MTPKKIKILIVDDFELARRLLKNILLEHDYTQLEEASDSEIAMQKLEEASTSGNPFQFIFSDLHMPTVSGFELLKMVRSNEKLRTIPFIIVSAEGETEFIVDCIRAGANDFLCKPINGEMIIKKLERVLLKADKPVS